MLRGTPDVPNISELKPHHRINEKSGMDAELLTLQRCNFKGWIFGVTVLGSALDLGAR